MTRTAAETGHAEALRRAIAERTARVCIVGMGYVGLPLAKAFVEAGFRVLGYDVDAGKVAALREGRSYVAQFPAATIAGLRATGRFEPTGDTSALAQADAIVICVPTPLTPTRDPDLRYVVSTAEAVARTLAPGQLVILESTTYPGTTEEVVRPILERGGLAAERDFFLAFSPEREDPGNKDFTTRSIPKVVGGVGPLSSELADRLYACAVQKTVPVRDSRVAEATKILENTYRAVNIALVNELKLLFHRMGIDIWEVIDASRTKPFGFQPFYPGPGLGGHCIPIDPFYLTWIARRYGMDTEFIELAGRINSSMPKWVLTRITEVLNQTRKSLNGSKVLVLGLAYKKDIDDTRESPSFPLIEDLVAAGAEVTFHDPFFKAFPEKRDYHTFVHPLALTEANVAAQDVVVIVTDHSSYDYPWLVRHARALVDTRGATRHLGRFPNVHLA